MWWRGAGLSPLGLIGTAVSPTPDQRVQSSLFGHSQSRTSSQGWTLKHWEQDFAIACKCPEMEVCRIYKNPEQAKCLTLSEVNKPFVHCLLKATCYWMSLLLLWGEKRSWEKWSPFMKWAKKHCIVHCFSEDCSMRAATWWRLLQCKGGLCIYRARWHFMKFQTWTSQPLQIIFVLKCTAASLP